MIHITDTVGLNERDITTRFVRAAGPGSEHHRTKATAVEMRFDLGKSSLPVNVAERLVAIAGRHVTTDGVLVIVGRAAASQGQNRDDALAQLVALVRRAAKPPNKRKRTHARRAVRVERRESKQRHSAVKRRRHVNVAAETATRVV